MHTLPVRPQHGNKLNSLACHAGLTVASCLLTKYALQHITVGCKRLSYSLLTYQSMVYKSGFLSSRETQVSFPSHRAPIGGKKDDGSSKPVVRPYTPENLGDQRGFMDLVGYCSQYTHLLLP